MTAIPNDCLRIVSSFLYPSKTLFADLARVNRLIVADRLNNSVHDPYFLQPFRDTRSYTGVKYDTQSAIDRVLVTHKFNMTRLFDTLNNYETLKMVGAGAANLWELRRYVQKKLFAQHADKMENVHHEMLQLRGRAPAVCCSGGCTRCGADLPLGWPALTDERWVGKGFCSAECFGSFNSSLGFRNIRRHKPSEDMHECENRYCKHKVHWADLEYTGGYINRVFCSDHCAHHEEMDEYEDDIMYQKYDYYLDRGW
jgi:hypothetical protein